jgi:hypothetical protein
MREVECSSGVAWDLSFVHNPRVLRIRLDQSPDRRHLLLAISTKAPQELTVPVLEIFSSGPQADTEDILQQLSSNILYLLDL